jgi:CheY-like chemotaxis protein
MELQSLVLSRDERIVRVLKRLLTDLEISVEHCEDADAAMKLLTRTKFDGVFADCDVEGASELLRSVRRSRTNKRSIAFAILSGLMSVRSAFEMGANFVLYKPVSVEGTKRSLRAAHGLMMRERRRDFRHVLESKVELSFDQVRYHQAVVVDVSQGGMAIKSVEHLEVKRNLSLRFTLPGMTTPVEADGRVSWVDRYGRAGIQFVSVGETNQGGFLQWLRDREVMNEPDYRTPEPHSPAPVMSRAPQPEEHEEMEIELVPPTFESSLDRDIRARSRFRGQFEAPLVVVTIRAGKTIVIRGKCEDLSEEGLGAEMDGELLLGDPTLIELSLPKVEEPMKLHAEVRHRRDSHYGFEFVSLSPDHRRTIRRFTEALPARE